MNINEAVKNLENVTLVDVRMPNEFADGHIPGAKNVPRMELVKAGNYLPDKAASIYVYCQSGARSKRAAGILQKLGYANVTDLGGISGYIGALEK